MNVLLRPGWGVFILLKNVGEGFNPPLQLRCVPEPIKGGSLAHPGFFVLNGNQHTAEVFSCFQKSVQAFPVVIRAGGIAVGVVPDETFFGMVQGDEVSAQLCLAAPAVEENAAVCIGCGFVEFLPVCQNLSGQQPCLPESPSF